MENIQTQPTAMERYFEQLLENQSIQRERADNYYGLAEKTAAQQSEWMDMLMAEYRKKQSANPFIALLDGYIGMRKNNDPNYQWKGLLGSAQELFQKRKYYDLGDGVSHDPLSPLERLNLQSQPNNEVKYKQYEGGR